MNRWICNRMTVFGTRAYQPGEIILSDQQPNKYFEADGYEEIPGPVKPISEMTKSEINKAYSLGLNKKDLKATKKPELLKMASSK